MYLPETNGLPMKIPMFPGFHTIKMVDFPASELLGLGRVGTFPKLLVKNIGPAGHFGIQGFSYLGCGPPPRMQSSTPGFFIFLGSGIPN